MSTSKEEASCEWRWLLSPSCPYHSSLLRFQETAFSLSLFSLVFMSLCLFLRLFVQRYPLWNSSASTRFLINPLESIFLTAFLFVIFRTIHSVLILYFQEQVPIGAIAFLYTFTFTLGGVGLSYYWIGLIAALPQEDFTTNGSLLPKLKQSNTLFGLIFLLIYLLLPIPDLFSARLLFSRQESSLRLFLGTYCIWCIVGLVHLLGIAVFSRAILRLLAESLVFETTLAHSGKTKELLKIRQLIIISLVLCFTVMMVQSICSPLNALFRLEIWRNKSAALFLNFVFNIFPLINCIIFYAVAVGIDVYHGFQKGKWIIKADEDEEPPRQPSSLRLAPSSSTSQDPPLKCHEGEQDSHIELQLEGAEKSPQ